VENDAGEVGRRATSTSNIATPANVTPPPYYPDHPVVREEWARYLNSVSGMDKRIGWVLERLRARRPGGRHHHPLLRRQRPPRAARHPLVLRQRVAGAADHSLAEELPAPAAIRAGTVNDEIISLIDLTATTLAASPACRGRC
jgi:N-sulfoglucosamine sulfohydrolase